MIVTTWFCMSRMKRQKKANKLNFAWRLVSIKVWGISILGETASAIEKFKLIKFYFLPKTTNLIMPSWKP